VEPGEAKSTVRRKIAVIVSPSFSGSTLLTYLLATHPQVSTIGERSKFWRKMFHPDAPGSKRCSCGVLFVECPFWTKIGDRVASEGRSALISHLDFSTFQFYSHPLVNKVAHKLCLFFAERGKTGFIPYPVGRRFRAICDLNTRLIDAVLELTNSRVFIDSSKSARHAVYLNSAACSDYDVYAIKLVRDGRGQVYSQLKRGWVESIEQASRRWLGQVRRMELLDRADVNTVAVKYERVCSRPAQTMADVFQFLGLDCQKGSLQFRDHDQHIMGNWDTRTGDTDQIRDKQEWRQGLTAEQLRIFGELAGETNRALGYT
jgi:hypothetical protein